MMTDSDLKNKMIELQRRWSG